MNLSKSIERHVADIPDGARLVDVDVHEDPDYPAGSVGVLCEFDTGHMFQVIVPLEGRPFTSELRAELEASVVLLVAVVHGLRDPALKTHQGN